jgi:hypothetical protein
MSETATKADEAIYIDVPPRILSVTGGGMLLGMAIGGVREARMAGMQFLAENAHRPPRTVRGWYLYSKTKNYRMLLAGLRGAGVESLRLGTIALGFATAEEGLGRLGLDEVKEVGAGLSTGLLFSGMCTCLSYLYRHFGWNIDEKMKRPAWAASGDARVCAGAGAGGRDAWDPGWPGRAPRGDGVSGAVCRWWSGTGSAFDV